MASTELDPIFVKGLRLLHSKNKDSAEQLKQLLDDVILQSKQSAHTKDRIYTSVKLVLRLLFFSKIKQFVYYLFYLQGSHGL